MVNNVWEHFEWNICKKAEGLFKKITWNAWNEKNNLQSWDSPTIITWATGWLWGKLLEFLWKKGKIHLVWWRRKEKLNAQLQNKKDGDEVIAWNLFIPNSEPYNYFMEQVPERWWIFFHFSAIDMDPIPIFDPLKNPFTAEKWWDKIKKPDWYEENWLNLKIIKNELNITWEIQDSDLENLKEKLRELSFDKADPRKLKKSYIKDVINPLTGKEWWNEIKTPDWYEENWLNLKIIKDELNITWEIQDLNLENLKSKIREKLADLQIDFFEKFLNNLENRDSKEPLFIVFSWSIISKFFENHSFNKSEYWKLKSRISELIEEKREVLRKKNVHIVNVYMGITDTDMYKERGSVSAKQTADIVKWLWFFYPLWGKALVASWPLPVEKVANFFYELWEMMKRWEFVPPQVSLYNVEDTDIEAQKKKWAKEGEDISTKILENKNIWITEDSWLDDEIQITDNIKEFLKNLRKGGLENYYNNFLKNRLEKEITKRFEEEIPAFLLWKNVGKFIASILWGTPLLPILKNNIWFFSNLLGTFNKVLNNEWWKESEVWEILDGEVKKWIDDKIKRNPSQQDLLEYFLYQGDFIKTQLIAKGEDSAERILERLPQKLSLRDFIDICFQLEGNYH